MKRPRVVKVPATELWPGCKDSAPGTLGVCIKYGSNGRDLLIEAGRHVWRVEHETWHDYYLTRREAREAAKR